MQWSSPSLACWSFGLRAPNARPADAHDAGFSRVRPTHAWGYAADDLDAGSGGVVSKVRPADAHDAGCLGVFCTRPAQLMLVMLAVCGLSSQSTPS